MDTIEKKFIDGEYYVSYDLFNKVFWDSETNKRKAERLEEENKKLKEENEQLKDRFMLRLAEAYLLPPKSPQMAEMKKRDFSKWYKEVKNQMRKEILEGK